MWRRTSIGAGVGKALLGGVIGRCEALGLRQMIADHRRQRQRRLHRPAPSAWASSSAASCAASVSSTGDWVDVVWMQRSLGAGEGSAPTFAGLSLAGG